MIVPIFANQKIRVSYKTTENITLLLRGQVRLPNGDIVDISDSKIVSGVTSGSVTSGTFEKNVPTGDLISHTIKTSTANIQRGQCFVRADVIYSADSFESSALCAKYITSESPISLNEFEDSLSGNGYYTNLVASGENTNELLFTPQSGIKYSIKNIYVMLTTDLTVANRNISIVDTNNSSHIAITENSQAANKQCTYSFRNTSKEIYNSILNSYVCILPLNIVKDNIDDISVTIVNGQATDVFNTGFMSVEQWIKS